MQERINLLKEQQEHEAKSLEGYFVHTLVLLMDNPGCFISEVSSPSRLKESNTTK